MENPQQTPPPGSAPVRPLSVWLVSGWYFVSGFFSISMIAMVQSRQAAPVTPGPDPSQPAPLQFVDILLAAFLIALNLCGAGFLFMLKKAAVPFFMAALALNVGTNTWYLFTRGMGGEPALMILGVALGWLVALTVCRYAANLVKTGVLR